MAPDPRRVLFICGKNRRRSPTAEQVFSAHHGVDVSSAGLAHDSDNPVSAELIEWAELIFVMERSQQAKLSVRFRRLLGAKRIVCLNIADTHEFMAPALVQLLKARVTPHLPS